MNLYVKDSMREILGLPTSKDKQRRAQRNIRDGKQQMNQRIGLAEAELNIEYGKLEQLKQALQNKKHVPYEQVCMVMRNMKSKQRILKGLYQKKGILDKSDEEFLDFEVNKTLLDTERVVTEIGASDFSTSTELHKILRKKEEMSLNYELMHDSLGVTDTEANVEDEIADEALDFFSANSPLEDIRLYNLPVYTMKRKGGSGGEALLNKNDQINQTTKTTETNI